MIHSLRHFFDTRCVNVGIPQRAVDALTAFRRFGTRADGAALNLEF